MSIIYSVLQKLRLRENNHGIYMVVIAYIISAVLLIFGSDVFYDIRSKAEKLSDQVVEETNEEDKVQIINPYGINEVQTPVKALNEMQTPIRAIKTIQMDPIPDDTYWLLGSSIAEKENEMLYAMEEAPTLEAEKNLDETLEEIEEEEAIESLSVSETTDKQSYSVTKDEVAMLERIVQAEAGGEDEKGKILIVNVIMNRIEDEKFPDSVEKVIFQKVGGGYQFSPISDKRYWSVKVSKDTKKAVERALEGEDYSEGALYFMARKKASSSNVKWFDKKLDWLFKHGGHEFYKNK